MVKERKKSDSEFFAERIPFYLEQGSSLKNTRPDCVDEYNDHSLLKLISINYWSSIFFRIAHRQLREKHGYKIAYVESMAGSGVTSAKRAGDYFCGSCTGTVLHTKQLAAPIDVLHAVEIDKKKAEALEERLNKIEGPPKIKVWPNDILNVSKNIAEDLKGKTISFVVIDPHALRGVTWEGISPLLKCKGDAMINWFEHDVWRLRGAAKSEVVKGQGERLDELFGNSAWKETNSAQELTDLFVNRVIDECNKTHEVRVKIPTESGGYYLMILFTGNFKKAGRLSNEWKDRLEQRINSVHGREISKLLDVESGRIASLDKWID